MVLKFYLLYLEFLNILKKHRVLIFFLKFLFYLGNKVIQHFFLSNENPPYLL